MVTSSQALSFGSAAERYDQWRPTYPAEAVRWGIGEQRQRIVDLGAGTGKLTRVLLELGHDVVAVEPDEKMRQRLHAESPGTTALAGTAESIPVPDGSVDAVMAGQAYHWFDQERAHPEIARVLRPGGVFAPIWNIRDDSIAWVHRLVEVLRERHPDDTDDLDFGPLFEAPDQKLFRHEIQMDADALVALVSTRSGYLTATPEQQAAVAAEVRQLAAELPPTFALPYITHVFRARKR